MSKEKPYSSENSGSTSQESTSSDSYESTSSSPYSVLLEKLELEEKKAYDLGKPYRVKFKAKLIDD